MKTLHTIYTSFAKRLAIILTLLLTLGVTSVWGAEFSLTNETIKNNRTGKTSYNSYTIGDNWGGRWLINLNGTTYSLQLGYNTSSSKSAYNSHLSITIPQAASNISILIKTNNNTAAGRTFYACSANNKGYVNSGNGDYGKASTSVQNGSATIQITGSPEVVYIYPNGTAYIEYVTVTYDDSPACSYIVTFNSNYGTNATSSQEFTCGETKALTANSFSRTGYTFARWNTKADGTGISYTNQQSVNLSSTNNDNIPLFAQWQINSYKVTWKPNGGNWSGNASDKVEDYNYGATIITPSNPTRYGYNFTGWTPTPATTMPASDQTYIAQWTEKSLTNYRTTCNTQATVSFDLKGGNGTFDNVALDGNTYDIPETEPTRNGYNFAGWKIQDGDNTVYKYGTTNSTINNITESITLVAQWSAIEYTITYHLNGGSGVENSTYTIESEDITLPTPTPEQQGLTFVGWYENADFTGQAVTKISRGSTGNKEFWAKWEKATPTFAWSAGSYTAALEADNNFPTLNNPDGLSVTYTSSNEGVATIDANGNITLVATGTTTITADGAETATHKSATDSYELTVVAANCKWIETDIANINSGDEVVVTMTNALSKTYALPNGVVINETDIFPTLVTVTNHSLQTVSDDIIWIINKEGDNLTFESYKNRGNFLLCNNADKGIRIDNNATANRKFVVDDTYGYLKNTQTTKPRYLGVHNENHTWYSYALTDKGNFPTKIVGQTLKFYKRECLDSENYWVTWDVGEGTWEDKSSKKIESYQVGATITAPTENPTREGYRFDGWTPAPTTMPAQNTTFTAKWTEEYKVTWYENGVPSYTYVPSDNAVVTWEDNIADCGEKKFYGWTADETFVSDPTTPPTLISKGTTIAGDITYYAVYADAEEPANPGYTKVTTISEGTYLIATDNTANKAYTGRSGTNTYGGYCTVEIVDNVIEEPESAVEVEVTLNGSNFYMHDGTYYLGYTSGNAMTFDASIQTGNQNIWKLTTDEGYIESVNVSGRILQYNSGSPRFACYTSDQKKAYLYKKQTTTYKNFAVSCATYDISVTTPTGGTVTTNPAVEAGAGQTITVNVTPADCKYLTVLKYNYNDGSDHNININIASTPYTFTMPAADVTVTATFADKNATDIEILTSAHRMLMQGSAFVGEQVRITYNNGDKETLNWNDSRLTFTGHNTATLGSQTVTVTYNDCGTQSASYNIEVIDGLGITFWDGDYTETIKYEPGDLVDVDNRIGQNICSGWEFAGWSETKVANESEEYVPVHNFNATDAKVLYAVYVKKKAQWTTIVTADEAKSRAKYVLAYDRYDTYYALTSSVKDVNYLTGKVVTSTEGELNSFDVYYLSAEPTADLIWELVSTGENGKWYLYNKNTAKYIDLSTQGQIHLTDLPSDKLQMESGYNDSQIRIASSTVPTYYLSWDNSNTRYNTYASSNSQEYWYTKDEEFTSTPPCSPLSATFHGNGGIVTDGVNSGDDLTITEPTRDAGITTPTASFTDCNGKSWTFVGWSREEIDVTRVPVLTTDLLHDGDGNKHYDIEEDSEEFWAVFTNTGDPETKYGTITFTDADVTRQYENAKTITKSVTAMGDYDFELYHVSNASSKGIQFDHDNATKGYIKNITSLGKINSISLNEFQTGAIGYIQVYVGNSPNEINTLLTAEELQTSGTTSTYYLSGNYSYFKIQAKEYCSLTSISIDFGKGTQIWATTPDCSTITLSGDELYVTSTNGQSIRAAERLTVKAVQLESKAKVVISSNSSDIYFSDVQDANFTQAVKPTETLTLTTDVDGNLAATEIYVHYRPSVDGTGIPEDVVVSANLETPNPGITDDHTIHVRNLPATFAIVAKVGNVWYALPSQGLNSTTPPVAYPVEVDNMADPTAVVSVPANADWSLRQVYTSSGSDDRFAANGENLVFVNNASPAMTLNASSSEEENYLLADAQYNNYYSTNPGLYEWTPTTTDLETYQLTNEQRSRKLSVNTATVFGVHAQNKAVEQVRFLPITGRYTPAAVQVVEWKENSVVIMYNGNPAQTASVSVNGGAAQNTTLSAKQSQRDIAVYELAANGLAANPTQRLSITIGTEKVILSIPYIISSAQTDLALLSGSTVAARQEVAKVSDMVILKGATLTAAGAKGNPYKFRNVTIYGGGKLVVPADNGFGVNSLTLRIGGVTAEGNYDYVYPEFVLNTTYDGAFTNTSGKINLDYVTTKEQYYTFVAPFAIETKDIKYPVDIYGSNVEAANRGSFEFQYYDGEARANGEKGWKVVEEDPTDGATLTAHKGYTFYGMPRKVSVNGGTSTRQKFGIHRIPMTETAAKVMSHENSEQTVTISAHPSEKNINSGWNLIGNPYMSTITGLDNQSIVTGTIVMVDNRWEWSDQGTQANRFIVFPSNDGEWYYTSQASKATLPAFKNFFVQIGDENATALSIPRNIPAAQAPARRAAQEAEEEIELAIVLEQDAAHADQLDFLVNDAYSAVYDRNADFTKMMNNTNFNLFGVHMDDYLSFVAIDTYTARSSVAIGYQVPQAGQYTLRLSDKPYVMWSMVDAIYVTDHEVTPEVTTNLLDEAYTFQVSNAETNTTRFSISIVPSKESGGTTTAVDDILHQDIQTQKFIYNDQLYILRGGVVYDAMGQRVTTINQ